MTRTDAVSATPTGPSRHVSRSVEETEAIAGALAARLGAGSRVLLYGDLGAGKTAFVRGLAAGLGLDPADVNSPTFTIVQEYRGTPVLRHVDLYRLERPEEVEDLDVEELGREAVLAVEWAERLAERWREGAWRVFLSSPDDDTRHIVVEPPGYSTR